MATNTGTSGVRTVVQNASIKYQNSDLIWDKVFPRLPLKTREQKVWKWNKGDFFRIPSDNEIIRAPETESWRWANKGSYTDVSAIKKSIGTTITDDDLRNEGLEPGSIPPTDMMIDAVEENASIIDRHLENKVASQIIATAWSGESAGGEDADGNWAPTGNTNTFVPDVLARQDTLRKAGVPVDNLRMVIDFTTFTKLKRCDELKAMIADNMSKKPTDVTASMIASALGLNEFIVASAIKSTAQEKADGTDWTSASIWDNTAKGFGFLYYYPPAIKRKMLATGVVATLPQLNGQIRTSKSWYEDALERRVVETTEENEPKLLAVDTGFLWKGTHTDFA